MSSLDTSSFTQKNTIDQLLESIFDEEIWAWKELWKAAEITYSYDTSQILNGKNICINTTLFEKCGWLDIENFWNKTDTQKTVELKNAYQNAHNIITQKIHDIQSWKETLANNTNSQSLYGYQALEEKEKLMLYTLGALVFEWEKAWLSSILTHPKKQAQTQDELNTQVFGEKISSSKEETKYTLTHTQEKLKKYGTERLSEKEISRYTKYLHTLGIYKWKKIKIPSLSIPEEINDSFLNAKINKEDIINLSNMGMDIIGLNSEQKAVIDSYAESMSDGPEGLKIPTTFPQIQIRHLLKNLFNHEIDTHSVTEHNNQQIIGNTRWAGSLEKDEWLAMLMENMFIYGEQICTRDPKTGKTIINIEILDPRIYMITTLGWEKLSWDDLDDFLEITKKLYGDSLWAEERKRRIFRWTNEAHMSPQLKDASYIRWMRKAGEQINSYILSDWNEWIDFYELFGGKFWFKNIELFRKIKSEKQSNNIIQPFFLADMMYFLLQKNIISLHDIKNKKISKIKNISSDFFEFLQKKYPFLDFWIEVQQEILKKFNKEVNHILFWMKYALFEIIAESNQEIQEILPEKITKRIEKWQKKSNRFQQYGTQK